MDTTYLVTYTDKESNVLGVIKIYAQDLLGVLIKLKIPDGADGLIIEPAYPEESR